MSIYDNFSEKDFDLLRQRAARAAQASVEDSDRTENTALLVGLGGEMYALPVESLTAVYNALSVVDVPCVPSYIKGIVNIRGTILPVLNLAKLVGLQHDIGNEDYLLVVVTDENISVVFQVKSVGDIVTYASKDMLPLPAGSDHNDYLQGVLDGDYTLINVKTILADPSIIVDNMVSDIDSRT